MSSSLLAFFVSNLTIWVFSYAAVLQAPRSHCHNRALAREADPDKARQTKNNPFLLHITVLELGMAHRHELDSSRSGFELCLV
jgi:hypothetical protein